MNYLIQGIKSGKDKNTLVKDWKMLLQKMKKLGIEQAILACTDLNVLLQSTKTPITIFDATKSLAEATVKKYLNSK